jgi:hypothetical protein
MELRGPVRPADGISVLVRVDDRLESDGNFERLEAGLPPLWSPAQGLREWLRASAVLDATPPGADKQPICEVTIADSVWAWPQ